MSSGLNNNNNYQYPNLPVSIIWPENETDIPWFMARLYEQMTFAINQKDNGVFQMAISTTPTLIPNMDSTGSYLINISGSQPFVGTDGTLNYWPSYIFQCCKTSPTQDGVSTYTNNQDGVGNDLGGTGLILSFDTNPPGAPSGPTFFYIAHDGPSITGSFNVNIQGTRL